MAEPLFRAKVHSLPDMTLCVHMNGMWEDIESLCPECPISFAATHTHTHQQMNI